MITKNYKKYDDIQNNNKLCKIIISEKDGIKCMLQNIGFRRAHNNYERKIFHDVSIFAFILFITVGC